MAGSNIYMQLITATGPVVGEGLLEGFEGSIELKSFGWGLEAKANPVQASLKDRFSAGGLASAGLNALGVGGKKITMEMQALTFEKRFDVASSQIHFCIDNHLPVVSASITVLHIKQKGRAIHEPGFILTAFDGHFTNSAIKAAPDGNSTEITESVTLEFRYLTMTYLFTMGKDNIPTAPFMYTQGDNPKATPSLS